MNWPQKAWKNLHKFYSFCFHFQIEIKTKLCDYSHDFQLWASMAFHQEIVVPISICLLRPFAYCRLVLIKAELSLTIIWTSARHKHIRELSLSFCKLMFIFVEGIAESSLRASVNSRSQITICSLTLKPDWTIGEGMITIDTFKAWKSRLFTPWDRVQSLWYAKSITYLTGWTSFHATEKGFKSPIYSNTNIRNRNCSRRRWWAKWTQ